MINVICCYCEKDMGQKDGKGVTGVSHGICPECMKKVMGEIKEMKKEL